MVVLLQIQTDAVVGSFDCRRQTGRQGADERHRHRISQQSPVRENVQLNGEWKGKLETIEERSERKVKSKPSGGSAYRQQPAFRQKLTDNAAPARTNGG